VADHRRSRRSLTGWGRTAPTVAEVIDIGVDELPSVLSAAGPRGVLARGMGRSYGDAAQNAGGQVLLPMAAGTLVVEAQGADSIVRAPAGMGFGRLITELLSRGLFVPVTPGTRQITLGGAVAADVHGKNHHVDGSFGNSVVELELVTADGQRQVVSPSSEPELFWATVGGMGLTGVVTSVAFRARPVGSGHMLVTEERLPDLQTLMDVMRASDDGFTYSVAWLDTVSGAGRGRGVLTRAEHAEVADLSGRPAREPWPAVPDPGLRIPTDAPSGLVSRASMRVFNELWFRASPRRSRQVLVPISSYFHPLDAVGDWNRLYGRRGLVQYQFVVPDAAGEVVGQALRLLSRSGHPSALAVLKRFGPGNPGLLSFPIEGWTLALDLPARPDVAGLLDTLDRFVAGAGGRVYLAKDARLTPDMLGQMYHRLDAFRRLRDVYDPERVFQSDLSRRLDL
jgi:decaprenylphospho-beta-D-ribofuranose 2-oxidase